MDPQTARQLQVAETCRKLDPMPPNMTRTYKHLLVDDKTKSLYCYIPKAGCTSWKFVFLNSTRGNLTTKEGASEEDGAQYRSYRYVHFADDLKSLRHFTQEERDHRLKTYFKFIVVRHPFDRLVSAYRDKFIKRQDEFLEDAVRIRILFRPRFSNKQDYVTFEEFIRYVVLTGTTEPFKQNQHWATYQDLCQPCFVKYDYIGKMETLSLDSDIILKIMASNQKLPLLHVQSTRSLDYSGLTRRKFLDRLLGFYSLDAEMFGYRNDVLFNNYSDSPSAAETSP